MRAREIARLEDAYRALNPGTRLKTEPFRDKYGKGVLFVWKFKTWSIEARIRGDRFWSFTIRDVDHTSVLLCERGLKGRGWIEATALKIAQTAIDVTAQKTGHRYVTYAIASKGYVLEPGDKMLLFDLPDMPGVGVGINSSPDGLIHSCRVFKDDGEYYQALPPVPGEEYTGGSAPGCFWCPTREGAPLDLRFILAYTRRSMEFQRGFDVRVPEYLEDKPRLLEYDWVREGVEILRTDAAKGLGMLRDGCQAQRDIFHPDDRKYCRKRVGGKYGSCGDDGCADCETHSRDIEVFDFSLWLWNEV